MHSESDKHLKHAKQTILPLWHGKWFCTISSQTKWDLQEYSFLLRWFKDKKVRFCTLIYRILHPDCPILAEISSFSDRTDVWSTFSCCRWDFTSFLQKDKVKKFVSSWISCWYIRGRSRNFWKGGLYTTEVTLNTNGVEGEWRPCLWRDLLSGSGPGLSVDLYTHLL